MFDKLLMLWVYLIIVVNQIFTLTLTVLRNITSVVNNLIFHGPNTFLDHVIQMELDAYRFSNIVKLSATQFYVHSMREMIF